MLSLFYAHFRDEVGGGLKIEDAAKSSIQAALHHPFDLTYPAWILFFLSIFTALAIGLAAWLDDDPLAGYGRLDRSVKDWRRRNEALKARLTDIKSKASLKLKREFEAQLKAGERVLPELRDAASAHESSRDEFRAQAALVENARQTSQEERKSVSSGNGAASPSLPMPEPFSEVDLMKRYEEAKKSLDALRASIQPRLKEFKAWCDARAAGGNS
jgi:hypothetical protein